MSTNPINNNNSGKQEISNHYNISFVSEENQISNSKIKKIIGNSLFISGQTNVKKYFEDNHMQLIGRKSFSFVLSESTYKESSNSSLTKIALCKPANFFDLPQLPYALLTHQDTYYVVNNSASQLSNVELYVKKYFQLDCLKVEVKDSEGSSFEKLVFFQATPKTFLLLDGQTDFALEDGTVSIKTVPLFNGTFKEFVNESSLNYTRNAQGQQRQLSFDLLPSSNADIKEIVKQITTDPKN